MYRVTGPEWVQLLYLPKLDPDLSNFFFYTNLFWRLSRSIQAPLRANRIRSAVSVSELALAAGCVVIDGALIREWRWQGLLLEEPHRQTCIDPLSDPPIPPPPLTSASALSKGHSSSSSLALPLVHRSVCPHAPLSVMTPSAKWSQSFTQNKFSSRSGDLLRQGFYSTVLG